MTNSTMNTMNFQTADMRIQPSAAFSALALCILGFPKTKKDGTQERRYPSVEEAISYILYGGALHGKKE